MSKRKQQAIRAAELAAVQREETKNGAQNLWRRFLNPGRLLALGIGLLLTIGVIGAAADHSTDITRLESDSWLSRLFPLASANPPSMPTPTPTPTPQLSKEYLYAGGRMLATEEAYTPNSATQPADLVVWRPVSGTWYIKDSGNGTTSTGVFGQSADKPVQGDFDGDGLYDFAVYRPSNGTWYILPSGGGSYYSVPFGLSSDIPAPADYDGDGRADIAVWRNQQTASNPPIPPSFFVLKSSTGAFQIINFVGALTTDLPVPADYDGDWQADAALFRQAAGSGGSSQWLIQQSSDNQLHNRELGNPALPDIPTPGDYDGDGKMDLAICRLSTSQWLILPSSTGVVNTTAFTPAMASGDQPVQGDYDGDGKTDQAVWRGSTGYWYIQQSKTKTTRSDQWGALNDVPVAAPMIR